MRRRGRLKNIIAAVTITAILTLSQSPLQAGEIIISSFSTSVQDQDENVKRNIFLACQKLNGHVIGAGTVFSFNDVVGEGSAKNGFVSGRVLYRDMVRYEPGGGLCQVSSTIYNAFLQAGLHVVRRYRHFQPVTYVPPGLDATIKYGKKDLKIKNIHSRSITIETRMNGSSLTIWLKSDAPLKFRYEIYTDEETLDTPLSKENMRIRKGISVYVYRKRFKGKKLIENFLLYRDVYPAVFHR